MNMTLADWTLIVEIMKEAYEKANSEAETRWHIYQAAHDKHRKIHPSTFEEEIRTKYCKRQYDEYREADKRRGLLESIIYRLEHTKM